MPIDRRTLLAGAAAFAAPLSAYGLDAAQFGVRPGAPDDQTAKLQRAIGEATRTRAPLVLAQRTTLTPWPSPTIASPLPTAPANFISTRRASR